MVHGMELGLPGGRVKEDQRNWRKIEEEEAGMQGPESYSERSKREDREALLCTTEHETRADDDAKPPVHPVRMRAFFVAIALTELLQLPGSITTFVSSCFLFSCGAIPKIRHVPSLREHLLFKFLACNCLLMPHYGMVTFSVTIHNVFVFNFSCGRLCCS